mgnify:FL=1
MISAFVLAITIGGFDIVSLQSLYFKDFDQCQKFANRIPLPIVATCRSTRVDPSEVRLN